MKNSKLRKEARIPRIHVDLRLRENARITLPPGSSRYLIQVLRLGAGSPLTLFNGDGLDFPGHILIPAKGAVQVQVAAPMDAEEASPKLRIHLGIGIPRGERMDLLIQKAVELGVTCISPLLTKRSVVRLDEGRLRRRQQHWQGILIAACEQSGRKRLPELSATTALTHWLALGHPYPLLLDPRSNTPLPMASAPSGALTLLVGPEGGLAPEERTLAQQAGFTTVRLGPRILRAETAPLAALAAIQALWGDFR